MALVEWLRGHILTGFPWNAFGYALAGEIHLAQSLALFGLPGLTLVTVAILASPACLADDPALGRWSKRLPVLALGLLVLMAGAGALRLAATGHGIVKDVKLRIMQPDVPEEDKLRPSARNEVMAKYLEVSNRATGPESSGMAQVTHLIWPESVFPFLVSRDADALADLSNLLRPKAVLLVGAGRAEDPLPGETATRFYNSLHIIDATGAILDSYDKVHLVPFGEYLPWQSTLEAWGLTQLTQLRGGFTPGPRLRTLDVPNAPPVGVLVCYEAIFPGAVVDPGRRPGWLLNVTNDVWFGLTPGPYQHFLQARARAIEEGLPLVRAANNGISAVIDPVGRIVSSLPLGATGVLDAPLPKAIAAPIYGQIGDGLFWAMMLVAAAFPVVRRLRSRP